MAYPEDIDTFREIENLPGLTYDPDDKRTLFMEDLQAVRDSIIAIETALGTDPAQAYITVRAWLESLAAELSNKVGKTGNETVGGIKTFSSPIIIPNGSAANPGIRTTTEDGVGLFRAAANILGLAAGGSEAMRLSSGAVTIASSRTLTSTSFTNARSFRLGSDYVRDGFEGNTHLYEAVAGTGISTTAYIYGGIVNGYYPRSVVLSPNTADEEYCVITSAPVLDATKTSEAGFDVYSVTLRRGKPIGGGVAKAHAADDIFLFTDNSTRMDGFVLPTDGPAIITFLQSYTADTADPIRIYTSPRGNWSGWSAPLAGALQGFSCEANGKNIQLLEPINQTVLAEVTADARVTVAAQYNAAGFDFFPFLNSKGL